MKFFFLLSIISLFTGCATEKSQEAKAPLSQKNDPTLTISVGGESRTFTRTQLQNSPLVKKIVALGDPTYKNRKTGYTAVPTSSLFAGLKLDSSGTMLFKCLDGFSAPLSTERLLNQDPKKSISYIAFETADDQWPPLKESAPNISAAPFYLIWENAEKSKISSEEWPFQLASFEAKLSVEKQFPLTLPSEKTPKSGGIQKGYKLFQTNCFACHTLNGQGESKKGPDLNLPYNPTEYMSSKFLAMLIRNPQNLHLWPQGVMMGFDRKILSDSDIQAVIAYLRHMKNRKAKR